MKETGSSKQFWDMKRYNQYKDKLDYKHTNQTVDECGTSCVTLFTKSGPFKLGKPSAVRCLIKQRSVTDPFLTLIRLKQKRQWRIEKFRAHCNYNPKKKQNFNLFNTYRKLQSLIDDESDKYLHSNYNWYYTGGNMHVQSLPNEIFIYYTSNVTDLSVINLRLKHLKWKVKSNALLCSNSSPIYQIESVKYNSDTIIGIRTKNNISINKQIDENGSVICKSMNVLNSDTPFVNINLNGMDLNEYVTVDATQEIAVWDIITNTKKINLKIPESSNLRGNYFAQSAYLNNNIITCVNKLGFFLLDKRIGQISNTSVLFYEKDERCGWKADISNMCVGKSDTVNCYVTTTNNVKYLDIRAKQILNTWSHELLDAPFLSDYVRCNDINTLCISSRFPDEKLLVAHNYKKCYLPNLFPTITNAFESNILTTFSQKDLALLTSEHLAASTTGVNIVSTNDKAFMLFATNSLGDVFVYPVNAKKDEYDLNNFKSKRFSHKSVPEPLHLVDRVFLNTLYLNVNNEPVQCNNTKKKKIQTCLDNLKNKNRMFSTHLSAKWYDEEDDDAIAALEDIEEINVNTNIESWLSNIPNKDDEQ